MATTDKIKLPIMEAAQAQKHVTHNDGLVILDALVNLSVKELFRNTPPNGIPGGGDRYIIGGTPTGAWLGKAYKLTAWQDGAWRFYEPQIGWTCYVENDGLYVLDQSYAWLKVLSGTQLQNLTRLGINTTADATNPVSAKINKALWTALTAGEGGNGDLVFAMNKEAVGDDVGFYFQQGFSLRAMIGLLANNNLTFKTSPDGSSFFDAIIANAANGVVNFPRNPNFQAWLNFNQSLTSSVTTNKVSFNNTEHNDANAFSGANNEFTAPVAGKYLFGATIDLVANTATAGSLELALAKNGTRLERGRVQLVQGAVTTRFTLTTTALLSLAANDKITVIAGHTAAACTVQTDRNAFWGHLVS